MVAPELNWKLYRQENLNKYALTSHGVFLMSKFVISSCNLMNFASCLLFFFFYGGYGCLLRSKIKHAAVNYCVSYDAIFSTVITPHFQKLRVNSHLYRTPAC
jgi:hypothetical protein